MAWKPKKQVTTEEVAKAKSLLQPGVWKLGVLEETETLRYIGAMHPNASGVGEHPGVEVWTNVEGDQVGASSMNENFPPWKPDPARRASAEERELVLAEYEKRGFPRDEADATVQIESGWDPTARNVQGFSGLIQFSPSLGPGPGGATTPKFRNKWGLDKPIIEHTAGEQAPLIGRFLDENVAPRKWKQPGDTYLTGAAPSFVGAADHVVIYKQGSKAWEQNPAWRPPDGGDITAGSIRALLLRRLGKGWTPPVGAPKAPEEAGQNPEAGVFSSLSEFSRRLRSALLADARGRNYGKFGKRASETLRDYQRAHGVKADALLGPATFEALTSDPDLHALLEFLVRMRESLTTDARARTYGKFGKNAANVIRDYQRAHRVKADGLIGPQTFDALTAELVKELVAVSELEAAESSG